MHAPAKTNKFAHTLADADADAMPDPSCKATDKKTKNRQATCRSPDVVAARQRSRAPLPVLWSRESLARTNRALARSIGRDAPNEPDIRRTEPHAKRL